MAQTKKRSNHKNVSPNTKEISASQSTEIMLDQSCQGVGVCSEANEEGIKRKQEEKEQLLAEQSDKLEQLETQQAERQVQLADESNRLAKKENDLLNKERKLQRREINAENGFIELNAQNNIIKQTLEAELCELNQKKRKLLDELKQIKIDAETAQHIQLDERLLRLGQKESQLADLERSLIEREQNAKAEFAEQNREALKVFEDEQRALLQVHQGELDQLKSDKKRLSYELREIKSDMEAVQHAQLDERQLKLDQKDSQLADLERSLIEREQNAKAGFAEQNQQSLKALETKQRTLQQELQCELEQLKSEKKRLSDEYKKIEKAIEGAQDAYTEAETTRIEEIENLEHDLNRKQQEMATQQRRLDREWKALTEDRNNLQTQLDKEMVVERDSHLAEVKKLYEKLDSAWIRAQELQELLADFQELTAILGDISPAEVLEQREKLNQENRELRRKLDQSDSAELEQDNEFLRNQVVNLENEISDIRPELAEVRSELANKRVAATERESIALEKRVLEQHKNILTVHIDDLESRIEQLTNAQKKQTPFPAMSKMDTDKDHRATKELEEIPALTYFAVDLQHRIAQAEKVKLYYPLEEIRTLIGGLAMSQLHVFQGISGTGKTSLAKAFAKAMGGFCTDIAVQAGWRDREDLLGHYNAFEQRFYEKDCLQALYKAQTPRYKDTCNVILLDEMNLSRPEQYFAEFLSALEKNDFDERLINLSESALPNPPSLLKEDRKIWVPRNVWFIGTANHDETTNELADKTYDRANVMTLPKQDHRFKVEKKDAANFSFKSLQKEFTKACKKHRTLVTELLDQLTQDDLTEQLADNFGLGWGNRFDRQALRFIPVIIESGGTSGEALDHLLSTRVMRNGKVTGRYDTNADDLGKLRVSLEDFWITANLEGEPSKSLALIDADRKRKEQGS